MGADLTVADRLDLLDLVARYAAEVDARHWDAVAALFTADGALLTPDPPRSLTPVAEARGSAAIVGALRRLDGFVLTFHHVTGAVLDSSGPGEATGRATAAAHHVEQSDPPRSWVWHLVYDDTFTRSPEGWRFSSRALTIRLIESRPIARL